MFVRRVHSSIEANASAISRIRCGRIVTREGQLERIEQHWFANHVSVAQVWWQNQRNSLDGDVCQLDFHVPWGMKAFVTLDYIRTGNQARYATFIGACNVLNEVARLKNAYAIVAHVTNSNISDRFLKRAGWERHLEDWPGRHFIRRMQPSVRIADAFG
ncbi:hypothetical protein [Rhodopirellula halodulae]|uniref:hypothetical protein n=1 Tax=Rhodopirellula halodulae TaxID=2894198 RepID=UPI001E383033|nr:hypothetical protein [Rhodopirellula sp. JC737]MCC9658613.1 hypothetical protein [Rhodopirellula sp. JC737]